jgi:hypothetical protein
MEENSPNNLARASFTRSYCFGTSHAAPLRLRHKIAMAVTAIVAMPATINSIFASDRKSESTAVPATAPPPRNSAVNGAAQHKRQRPVIEPAHFKILIIIFGFPSCFMTAELPLKVT